MIEFVVICEGSDHKFDVGSQRPSTVCGDGEGDPRGVGLAPHSVAAASLPSAGTSLAGQQILARRHRNALSHEQLAPALVCQHRPRECSSSCSSSLTIDFTFFPSRSFISSFILRTSVEEGAKWPT